MEGRRGPSTISFHPNDGIPFNGVATAEVIADPFVCVAIFEFTQGPPDRQVIYTGREADCQRLARQIERACKKGRRGLRYKGDRGEPPLHALVAVCPATVPDQRQP